MMNYFWMNEQIPTKMQTVYVKSMYKGKGNISELENQRGLFLASNILKTYEKMFMNRVYPEMEAHGFSMFQCGGRKDHSPTDQVFVLRAAMEYLIYMGKEYFIEFCDLKKAFDKMILTNVMDNLWDSILLIVEFDSTHHGVSGQDWDRRCPLPSSKKRLTEQTHKAKKKTKSSICVCKMDNSHYTF